MFFEAEELDCLDKDVAWAYDFFYWVLVFFLKYFDNLLTSFCDLAGIGGGMRETNVGFTTSFPLLLFKVLGTWGVNLELILLLKVVLELST